MPKHFLSICCIIRNESFYLPEFLAFHRLQGVEHFYIYHNEEPLKDPALEKILYEEIEKDVSWIVWPGKAQQMPAYNDCLKNYGHESEWVAFIDVDEFLWSPNYPDLFCGLERVEDVYETESQTLDKLAGLAVPWTLFGSNGEKEKRDGLVIERFTTRASVSNKHVKSIVRPRFIQSVGKDPHTFYPKDSKHFIINESGERMPRDYALHGGGASEIIRCNHYHTKSHGEYIERRRKPDAGSGKEAAPAWVEEKFRAHDCNELRDFTVRDRYAQKIKDALCSSPS